MAAVPSQVSVLQQVLLLPTPAVLFPVTLPLRSSAPPRSYPCPPLPPRGAPPMLTPPSPGGFHSTDRPVLAGWFIWRSLFCQEQGRIVRKHRYGLGLLLSLPSRWEEDGLFPPVTTALCVGLLNPLLSPQLFVEFSSRAGSVGSKMARS